MSDQTFDSNSKMDDLLSSINDNIRKLNEDNQKRAEAEEKHRQKLADEAREAKEKAEKEKAEAEAKSQEEKEKQKKASDAKHVSNAIGGLVQSTVSYIASFAKETIEGISYIVDTALESIEANAKIASQNIDLVTSSITKSTSAVMKSYTGSITESAYAAANNAIDLSVQQRKLELDTQMTRFETQTKLDYRKAQNEAKISDIKADRSADLVAAGASATAELAETTRGISAFGVSLGDSVAEGADFAAKVATAGAKSTAQFVHNANEIQLSALDAQNKLYVKELQIQTEIKKKWLDAAAEVKKEWLALAQYTEGLLEKHEDASIEAGKSLGKNTQSMYSFQAELFKTQVSISKWNKTMEDMAKAQESYVEESGRSVELNESDYNKQFALGKLVGDDVAAGLNAQMNYFNKSVSDSSEIFYEMYKNANKVGISNKKYAKELNQNLKIAQKYTFKGGVKALMEMSLWANKVRFNMQNLEAIVDKVQNGGLEGLITQAASLQVLGGKFAMGADPIAMMYESWSDPESLIKRFTDMSGGMGQFNKKTGEVEIVGPDAMMIKQYADVIGMDIANARAIITQRIKQEQIDRQLSDKYNEAQKQLIYNKAQYGDDGKWYVTVNNELKDINSLGENDFTELLPLEEKLVDYAGKILSNTDKLAAATKEQNSVVENETLKDYRSNVDERINNVLTNFYSNLETTIQEVVKGFELATSSQVDAFTLAKQRTAEMSAEMSNLDANTKQLTQSFQNATTAINEAVSSISSTTQNAVSSVQYMKNESTNAEIGEALKGLTNVLGGFLSDNNQSKSGYTTPQMQEGGSTPQQSGGSGQGSGTNKPSSNVKPSSANSSGSNTSGGSTAMPYSATQGGSYSGVQANMPYGAQGPTEIKFSPVNVSVGGSVDVTCKQEKIDILGEFEKNPELVRKITFLIQDAIVKQITGGRSKQSVSQKNDYSLSTAMSMNPTFWG